MKENAKSATKNQESAGLNTKPTSEFKTMPTIEKGEFSVFDLENELQIPENQDVIKTKRCGSVDKYENFIKAYQKSKSDFSVVSYGATKKIVYGKNQFIFSGVKGEKKPKGVHLISLVKKDIDKLIKDSYNPTTDTFEIFNIVPKIPEKKPHLTYIHHNNLDFFGEGQEALAIDINHCYWRTAFMLGFISPETYKKGIEKTEYKDGRLIAIGTLGKIITVKQYKQGVKVAEYIDNTDYIKYGAFFWAVICHINNIMLELAHELKEDFLMFITDCVVIDPSRKADAIRIMEKHGYGTKEYRLVFTEISEKKVAWLTEKGEHKHIIHNQMLDNPKGRY